MTTSITIIVYYITWYLYPLYYIIISYCYINLYLFNLILSHIAIFLYAKTFLSFLFEIGFSFFSKLFTTHYCTAPYFYTYMHERMHARTQIKKHVSICIIYIFIDLSLRNNKFYSFDRICFNSLRLQRPRLSILIWLTFYTQALVEFIFQLLGRINTFFFVALLHLYSYHATRIREQSVFPSPTLSLHPLYHCPSYFRSSGRRLSRAFSLPAMEEVVTHERASAHLEQ